jgi:NDP-sugar pyrophosphorylase family protein
MDYICLAAGKGKRFSQLSLYLSKAMYPVYNKPFLQYSIDNLLDSVFNRDRDRLMLVVGHFSEQIIDYFSSSYRGIPIQYIEQEDIRGTGKALKEVFEKTNISDICIVWQADVYIPKNLFQRILQHPGENVLTTFKGSTTQKYSIKTSEQENETSKIVACWNTNTNLLDMGLWKLQSALFQQLATIKSEEYRALENLNNLIQKGTAVHALSAIKRIHIGEQNPTKFKETITSFMQDLDSQ